MASLSSLPKARVRRSGIDRGCARRVAGLGHFPPCPCRPIACPGIYGKKNARIENTWSRKQQDSSGAWITEAAIVIAKGRGADRGKFEEKSERCQMAAGGGAGL